MKNPCIFCGQRFAGLWWVIPDDAWLAIAPRLAAGEACPWCADAKLAEAGIQARAEVHLDLDHFHAPNGKVIAAMEALDGRMMREAAC